jgi:tRNA(fMet)-specific endonuclease VapC
VKYILDTNTLIYFFKGIGNVSAQFLATKPQDIGIPSIVIFELEVGIGQSTYPKKRRIQLRDLISLVNIIPFNLDDARQASKIRIRLEKMGQPIGTYDILIAASAVSRNSTLITHNIKEFRKIKGLKIEDWY